MAVGTLTAAISTAEIKRLQSAAAVMRDMRDQPDKGSADEGA